MTTITELVAALRADKLKLLGVFDALAARGRLSDADYRAEVDALERMRDDGSLEPVIVRALLAKLESLQGKPTAGAPPAGADVSGSNGDDAAADGPAPGTDTADTSGIDADHASAADSASAETPAPAAPVDGATGAAGLDASQADATVVKPASRPSSPPTAATDAGADIDAEVTRIQPASRPPAPPASGLPGAEDATMVKPASGTPRPSTPLPGATGTQGRTGTGATGTSQSSWRHMAEVETSDYVAVGSLLKGRFYLEKELGRGGMGVVFKARDERKVEARDRDPYLAVKVLNDEFRRHPDSLIALQRESRRSQQLAHDNIVRVFDFDKDRATVFMTMEYIDGSDLKALIRERAYNGMPLADARPLIEGMARALKRAHSAGVVHSDFKPGNVMVTREGVPKVFDFGIARAGKHMGDAVGEQTVFDAGTLGALTPAYASLEMIHGKEPSPGDDIYALGCVTFELLTGKHPFDKVSAEVAMKEGRKPPPVPGLTRHQYRTLCAAIAFTADQRLKSADELVEGLRDVGLRERAMPYVLWGGAAAILVAAGTWGWISYTHHRDVAEVVSRFAIANPDHYANEKQAEQALDSLGEDDRKRIVIDQGDLIQTFLLGRIDAYWNPAKDRYDYVGAQRVFALRDSLKLYSTELDVKRSEVDKQKNELLNTLDTQLSQQIDAGSIFDVGADNAVKTLERIHAIDPDSALLKNAELELKYDRAVGESIAGNHLDEAQQRLAQARKLFPDSTRLARRGAQLEALSASLAAQQAGTAPTAVQSIPEARKALATLVAAPRLDAGWQGAVAAAMAMLDKDDAPETRQLVARLGDAVAATAASHSDPAQLPQAVQLVDFGLTYAPQSKPLLAQRDKLAALQQQQQASADREAAAAEVKSRIESMKRAAAAGDTGKAGEALARIRALQPDNPFLKSEGPQLLANAYLGLATDTARAGQYRKAADALRKGIGVLGNRTDLRRAQARYEVVADIMQAGSRAPAPADWTRLQQRLDAARKADPDALAQLEAEMRARGQLQERSLAERLDKLKPAAPAATPSQPVAPTPTTPQPAAGTPDRTTATGAPATTPASQPAQPAASQPGTKAPAASAAAGNDTCAKPGLPGSGKLCFDTVAGQRGPLLVVVPGIDGGKPYAMSRTEISVVDFNKYCSATKQCAATAVADRDFGNTPVSNISVAQARAYATWLSGSGHTYRLPTAAEWAHAAAAGGRFRQADDSNCIPPSSDGTGAPVSARGRSHNPWGLVNMTGNVWEWVTSGGGVAVRGGSFTSYWSDCNVDTQRSDSGSPQKDVGFRVLREVQ